MSATTPVPITPSLIPRWLSTAAWIAVVIWAGSIFWLSSRSGREIEKMNIFKVWDKAAHFIAFASGAVPAYFGVRWTFRAGPGRSVLIAAGLVSLYGALDEYHQLYTPGRSGADVFDWTADTLGAITGAALTAFIYARKQRPQAPPGSSHPAPAGD